MDTFCKTRVGNGKIIPVPARNRIQNNWIMVYVVGAVGSRSGVVDKGLGEPHHVVSGSVVQLKQQVVFCPPVPHFGALDGNQGRK
jgi:hypothetical protein